MDGLNLLETINRSQESSKVVLDILLLVAVFAALWLFFRNRRIVFVLLFVSFVVVLSLEEILTTQRITIKQVEDELDGVTRVREVLVENEQRSPLQTGCYKRIVRYLPLIFSGVVQIINAVRGDRKYLLTKGISAAIITNSLPKIIYRTYLKGPLPEKVIFVCQHIEYMLETLLFTAFVPNTHKLTVMNRDVTFLLHHLVQKHLYGSYLVELKDKTCLKKQLIEFSKRITDGKDPEVFCIWASGDVWKASHPNGIRSFKPGAFYMSTFTQTPICIIHSRISEDSRCMVVEQSDLIYPPPRVDTEGTVDYMSFYENPLNRETIEGYCKRVELLYRGIDDGLAKETKVT
jgi:hypothetical protein